MSYDLYFHKQKGANLSGKQIADYLSTNLVAIIENSTEWVYENQHTEVYYSFSRTRPEDDPENTELYESFDGFDNTGFSFNLNFMRPCFFGLEAFQFVEQFITDLDLFVVNPQSYSDNPYKPTKEELFDNWNKTNLWASADQFDKNQSCYIAPEKSNETWNYNFNRSRLQDELGDNYFVPGLFFFKVKETSEVITITTWTEHIPCVIPPADYFLLTRKYKRLFRTIKENILVSVETLLKTFDPYFSDFEFKKCKIIHEENSIKAKNKFNSIKPEKILADFAERLPMEYLYNAKP